VAAASPDAVNLSERSLVELEQEQVTTRRASFYERLGALIVDGIIVAVVPIILYEVSGATAAYLAWVAIGITYELYFVGSTGQTPGRRVLHIRIVDRRHGGPIGYGRAAVRIFGRWLSAIPLYLGYFWMLWDKESQCWQDKMANDVVIPDY
jgi:uncharacterized RDD family membrane protein YckC